MVVANGDINIDGNIWPGANALNTPVLEGVYISDGRINTNYNNVKDKRLTARGIFAGIGGFDMTRDLSDADGNNYPDEYFVYDPTLMVKFRDFFGKSQRFWVEVAPALPGSQN